MIAWFCQSPGCTSIALTNNVRVQPSELRLFSEVSKMSGSGEYKSWQVKKDGWHCSDHAIEERKQ